MKGLLSFASFVFLSCFVSAFGQNLSEIKEKYGQPIEAYSVSEHIWMTPKFTSDGQVCSMRLYPKRISANTNYLGNILDKWEVKDFILKIAPRETWGAESPFSGLNLMGHMYSTSYIYENIGFRFLSSLDPYAGLDQFTKSREPRPNKTVPIKEFPDNINLIPGDASILTIFWTKRVCDGKK